MTLQRLPMCAELINQNYADYSLLDIGCRTMDLKPLLKNCREYYGTDLLPAEGVIQCNLEDGLPGFKDNSYDVVVALDVLEHLEHAHLVMKEMTRVARKAVFIALPNIFHVKFRWNFIFGKGLSGKYAFPADPVLDRHRWVMSYDETVKFVTHNAKSYDVKIWTILASSGKKTGIRKPIEETLAKWWPNAFAYGALFMINIDGQA